MSDLLAGWYPPKRVETGKKDHTKLYMELEKCFNYTTWAAGPRDSAISICIGRNHCDGSSMGTLCINSAPHTFIAFTTDTSPYPQLEVLIRSDLIAAGARLELLFPSHKKSFVIPSVWNEQNLMFICSSLCFQVF